MMVNREALFQAMYCRTSTHYGVACGHCPYGRKATKRWACDFSKICADAMEIIREDAVEINMLAHQANDYKVRLMARGESVK